MALATMLLVPVQAGDVTTNNNQQQEDPRQPSANNTTLYLHWDGMAQYWSHFQPTDDNSPHPTIREDEDNGVINVNYKFTMNPTLTKRLNMTVGGEIRANFHVYYEGDSDSTDNAGPCQPGQTPNDCDWLNVSIFKGGMELYQHTEQPWIAGKWQNIMFSFQITEEMAKWDSSDDNPSVQISMKVKGNQQNTGPGGMFLSGDPAAFEMRIGGNGTVEFPIDQSTWNEDFQAGLDELPPAEETPGFTLVVASAAIAMAIFVNSKDEESEQ